MLTWEQTRLTTAEEATALVRAGIPLDPAEWTREHLERAAEVLDAAFAAKLARLLAKEKG